MENKNKSMGYIDTMKWMYSFVKVYKGWLFIGVITTVTLIIANIFKAYYTQEIVNKALDGEFNQLVRIMIIFAFITVTAVISQYISKYATGKYALYATKDMKEKLSMHLTRVSIGSTKWTQSGDLASRLNNDTEHVTNFMKNDFSNIVVQLLMGLVAFVYILFINWKLLIVSVSFLPFLMYAASVLNKKMGKFFPESYKYLGIANGEVEEAIIGIDMLKTYNLEKMANEKVKEIYEDNFETELKISKYMAPIQPVCITIAWFPRLVCALYGGYMALNGEVEVGTLIAVLQLLDYVAIGTAGLPFVLNNIKRSIAAIGRIEEIFHMPEERTNGEPIKEKDSNLAIEFHNVSFGYNKSQNIIKGLSFKLNKNKMIALVGTSGSGKSTIINLICDLYQYHEGKIELFGCNLKKFSIKSIRDHIAVVSQDTYLFPGTIAENIMYGRKDASMEEIIEAAKAAQANEFISDMPQGYNTILGEGGINLSGGQRQRISIARAFLKNAPILLLDEPTASLDNYAETLIQKSLENLISGRTVLVVAHRLSTVIKADNIIVLKDGSILEKGTHSDLFNKKGYYYQLYNNQFLNQKEVVGEEIRYV